MIENSSQEQNIEMMENSSIQPRPGHPLNESTVSSYYKGWLKWGGNPQKKNKISKNINNEFEVTHTNWFWRNKTRNLIFGHDSFERTHPTDYNIRASHKYSDLKCAVVKSPTTLIFKFNSTASEEWITCPENVLQDIIKILTSKSVSIEKII